MTEKAAGAATGDADVSVDVAGTEVKNEGTGEVDANGPMISSRGRTFSPSRRASGPASAR